MLTDKLTCNLMRDYDNVTKCLEWIKKFPKLKPRSCVYVSFLKNFPKLMDYKILISGIVVFIFGWMVQRFMLK